MTISETELTSRFLVMPEHMNPAGTAFGGIIVSWMDMVAAMCAEKYSATRVATVSIDCLSFLKPVHAGDHVVITAVAVYSGNTTVEIDVTVFTEDPVRNASQLTTHALFTFVALSETGEKKQVPELSIVTDEDRMLCERAKLRRQYRKDCSCRDRTCT
ncbi:MAG: acyl-CoA thioesterase [Spirochaetota bacterium]